MGENTQTGKTPLGDCVFESGELHPTALRLAQQYSLRHGDKGKNMFKLVHLYTRRSFPTPWRKRDVDAK